MSVKSVKNIYILSVLSSVKTPIALALNPGYPGETPKEVIAVFPITFSNAPTSLSSDSETATFKAFLYSLDGINLSSKSLFILDARKEFLTSAIYYDFIHLDLPLIT